MGGGGGGGTRTLTNGGGCRRLQPDPCWLHLSGAGLILQSFSKILQQWQVTIIAKIRILIALLQMYLQICILHVPVYARHEARHRALWQTICSWGCLRRNQPFPAAPQHMLIDVQHTHTHTHTHTQKQKQKNNEFIIKDIFVWLWGMMVPLRTGSWLILMWMH